jgi:hypothetical protein
MRSIVHAADGRPSGSSLQVIEQVNGITNCRTGGELDEHDSCIYYNLIVLINNQTNNFAQMKSNERNLKVNPSPAFPLFIVFTSSVKHPNSK